MGCSRETERLRTIPVLILCGVLLSCGGPGVIDPPDPDPVVPNTNNQSPTASITNPSDGAVFFDTEPVPFDGSGTDPEDGTLFGGSFVWSSSLDGRIGTGTSVGAAALSLTVGTHTITLTVTDSDGATATASISITINQDLTPGSISGRLLRSNDNTALEGVGVLRSGPDGDEEAITNPSGEYEFVDVPVGTHDVSIVGEDLPPFGSSVMGQQVTLTGGLGLDEVDFAFEAAEVQIRAIADVATAFVGEEITVTLEIDITEIPSPLSGVSGTIKWVTARTELVSGSVAEGGVWNDTGGSFLANESPTGTLNFAGVSPTTGVVDDVFTLMTFRATALATGNVPFKPDLAELDVFDPGTGVITPLLDIVFLRSTSATVSVFVP